MRDWWKLGYPFRPFERGDAFYFWIQSRASFWNTDFTDLLVEVLDAEEAWRDQRAEKREAQYLAAGGQFRQREIAGFQGISQPAVVKRLEIA